MFVSHLVQVKKSQMKFNRPIEVTIVLVFFVALFFKINYRVALACSCMRPLPPLEEKERATAVFAGQVISKEQNESQIEVNFRVQTIWKGELGDTVTIATGLHSAACGINFNLRETYLVYAFGNNTQLRTNSCSRTQLLSRAKDDLRTLESLPDRTQMNVLNNTTWELERLNDQKVLPNTNITASFNNGKITGTASCNLYNGTYRQKGNAIRFVGFATTRMSCERLILQQESNYLKALSAAYSFKIDRDRLTIDYYDGKNEGILVYHYKKD